MTSNVLVTGATGFVGSALVLELLDRTDANISCLVRERSGSVPLDRLRSQLLQAMTSFEKTHLERDVIERVTAVPGDVTDDRLPDLGAALGPLDAIWHSAASLKHQDVDADEIRLSNVTGVRNIVRLAERTGAAELNHISTAYVAGRRSGRIFEQPVPPQTPACNQYERSKIDGESIVASSQTHYRVFRPSVIIGHSSTLAAESGMGVYGFLREMHRFMRAASRRGDLPTLTLDASMETSINLIPVDLVVSAAVDISLSSTSERYFHLTNNSDNLVSDAIPIVCEMFGLPKPRFSSNPDDFSPTDKLLSRYLDFYLPYLGGERIFDRTNTDAIVGDRCDYASGPGLQRALVQSWLDEQLIEQPSRAG